MSAAKHSAGWEPIGFILDGDDWEAGEIGFILKTDGRGVTIDDLRKAAAAPELLEALTELVKVIDHPAMHVLWCEMIDKLSTYRGPRFDVDKARAAIAKASGA